MVNLLMVYSLLQIVERLKDERVRVWCTPSVAPRLSKLVPWEVCIGAPHLEGVDWLLVAGGGTVIDQAKVLRSKHPQVKLAALPTLWGSGAEASPIAVLNEDGKKVIRMGPELLPDLIVSHPAFAESLSGDLIKQACGDAWSHALEGFLSPLGSDETRSNLAGVLKRMLQHPIDFSPEWFELSALACAGQSKASVGAVHGIAHVLEGIVHWGHAKLCSLYLLPVMSFNQMNSPKWPLLAAHGLQDDAIFAVLRQFFDPQDYRTALPALKDNWMKVLRDPCSRTNSALVRPSDFEFFESFKA